VAEISADYQLHGHFPPITNFMATGLSMEVLYCLDGSGREKAVVRDAHFER
jgi:hypothetical protein